jgi:hypothetical protein
MKNWVNESGCIAKSETEYLGAPVYSMAVGALTVDRASCQPQEPIGDLAKWLLARINHLDKIVSYIK